MKLACFNNDDQYSTVRFKYVLLFYSLVKQKYREATSTMTLFSMLLSVRQAITFLNTYEFVRMSRSRSHIH